MAPGNDDRPYYGRARQVGGLLLFVTACVLVLMDAIRPDYSVESMPLGLLLGTGLTLLAVEFRKGDDR